MLYNDCYKLDFSVFDIIDAALSYRIFLEMSGDRIADRRSAILYCLCNQKDVLLIVSIKFFFNSTFLTAPFSSSNACQIRIDKLTCRDVN